MSYQIIKNGTNDGTSGSPQIIMNINRPSVAKERIGEKKISKKQIINLINHINFQNGSISVNFKHKRFDISMSLQAKPQLLNGNGFSCLWVDMSELYRRLSTYEFENITLRHQHKNLVLKPEVIDIDNSGISLSLLELFYPLQFEKNLHHPCRGIKVQLIQNSAVFNGVLTDFSPGLFIIRVSLAPPHTPQWINSDMTVEIVLANETETLYSGECLIQNQTITDKDISIRLKPKKNLIKRFKSKKFRSKRFEITPYPDIFFRHPFINKLLNIKVRNLSGLGFSVEEKLNNASLFPGMILPMVEMSFANSFKIRFKAQVLYHKEVETKEGSNNRSIRYGLTILDINTQDHLKLLSYLYQANDKNVYICNTVDIDALWEFFFESGFIYPDKYKFLQPNKTDVKETYKKVYTQLNNIARHFTYQDNGIIHSHLAMIRFYENSWLIHHHASNRAISFRAGLSVLNQIGLFSFDSSRLYSNHMNYLLCYFRPENKFPNRVFGGAARTINDKAKCCLESFGYLHFNEQLETGIDIPLSWSLTQTDTYDIEELNAFYTKKASLLMLKALDLEKHNNNKELYREYNKSGLKRERHLFSLRNDEQLKAIIIINIADVGLNLSDLTSSVTIMILDQDNLNKDIIWTALSLLSTQLNLNNFPVLIYPFDFVENNSMGHERKYCLWILDTQYGDNYFNYVSRLTRLI